MSIEVIANVSFTGDITPPETCICCEPDLPVDCCFSGNIYYSGTPSRNVVQNVCINSEDPFCFIADFTGLGSPATDFLIQFRDATSGPFDAQLRFLPGGTGNYFIPPGPTVSYTGTAATSGRVRISRNSSLTYTVSAPGYSATFSGDPICIKQIRYQTNVGSPVTHMELTSGVCPP